jgi:RNA polymerase sigma factor (sigma-70 family)
MTTAAVVPTSSGGVLVASPSVQVREQVLRKLSHHGHVHTVSGGAEALAKLEDGQWQMLFLDRRLPDLDAEGLLEIIERRFPGTRVVMVDVDDAQPARSPHWPTQSHAGTLSFPRTRCPELEGRDAPLPGMIGETGPMRQLYRMVRLVARRDTTVLITGPTGSGKDLVARALHQLSPRADNGFFVLNCAAIPETLVESELFGHLPNGRDDGPLTQFLRSEMRDLLARAIDELPEKERRVLALYYFEELTMKEVGAVLGVGESRVSQIHSMAVLRLRARMAELTAPQLKSSTAIAAH